jgi:hypothetical protein
MKYMLIYDDVTGRIKRVLGTSEEAFSEFPQAGESSLEIPEEMRMEILENFYFISQGTLTERSEMPVTIDGQKIIAPPGVFFIVKEFDEFRGNSDDGVLEFSFSESGLFTIFLEKFPYRNREVILEN